MRVLLWMSLCCAALLACDDPDEATCAYEGGQLGLGASRDDPWLCLRCTCEEGGLRCVDIEGCVSADEPEFHINPPPRRDAEPPPLDPDMRVGGPDAASPDADVEPPLDASSPADARIIADLGAGTWIGACGVETSAEADIDGDTLTEREEAALGTNPCDVDSDDDGQSDGAEAMAGTNPLDPEESFDRYLEWSSPLDLTLTTTWRPELKQTDVTFLLDQTGSMALLLEGVAQEFAAIAEGIEAQLPTPSFGLATFADYRYRDMGGPGDLPFYLKHPQTHDRAAVSAALAGLMAHGGGDGPESIFEAFHQAFTGAGYDLRCDGRFDVEYDVPPRASQPGDLFGGSAPMGPRGLGKTGGLGYRYGSLPIVIYGTDAPMRAASAGDEVPGGCPMDAEREVVVGEALALGARFIGVMLEPFAGEAQARALALDTNSLDAEGAPLVYSWDQADPEGLREIILAAIQHLAGGLRFESAGIVVVPRAGSVEAEIIASEPHGVGPLLAHELPEALTFELTLALPARAAVDQLVLIDLRLVADNAVEMGQQTWIVRVPQF